MSPSVNTKGIWRQGTQQPSLLLSRDELSIIFSYLTIYEWKKVALAHRQFQELLLQRQSNSQYPVLYLLKNQERLVNQGQFEKIRTLLQVIAHLRVDTLGFRKRTIRTCLDTLLLCLQRVPELQEDLFTIEKAVVKLMKITRWTFVNAIRCTAFPDIMERGILACSVFSLDASTLNNWMVLDCALATRQDNTVADVIMNMAHLFKRTDIKHSDSIQFIITTALILNYRLYGSDLDKLLRTLRHYYNHQIKDLPASQQLTPQHLDEIIDNLLNEYLKESQIYELLDIVMTQRPERYKQVLGHFLRASSSSSFKLRDFLPNEYRSNKELCMKKLELNRSYFHVLNSELQNDIQVLELVTLGKVTTPNAPHETGFDFTKCMTKPPSFHDLYLVKTLENKSIVLRLLERFPKDYMISHISESLLQDSEVLDSISVDHLFASDNAIVTSYIMSKEELVRLALDPAKLWKLGRSLTDKLIERYASIPEHFFNFIRKRPNLLLNQDTLQLMVKHCGSLKALMIECITRNPNVVNYIHSIGFRFSSFSEQEQQLIFKHLLGVKDCDTSQCLQVFQKEGLLHKNMDFITSLIATHCNNDTFFYHPDIYRKMVKVNPGIVPQFIRSSLDIAEFMIALQEVPELLTIDSQTFFDEVRDNKLAFLFIDLKHRHHAQETITALIKKEQKTGVSSMISSCFTEEVAPRGRDAQKRYAPQIALDFAKDIYLSLLQTVTPTELTTALKLPYWMN